MNKNRKVSSIEAKLIEDYFTSKNIKFSEIHLSEMFHKDDEVIIRFMNPEGKEKVKTMKATELIAFAYSKSKSIDSGSILKEVQDLVSKKLEAVQIAVMNEIEKLTKQTSEKIDTALLKAKEGKEEEKTTDII